MEKILNKTLQLRTGTKAGFGVPYRIAGKEYVCGNFNYMNQPMILTERALNEAYYMLKNIHTLFTRVGI